MKKLVSVFVLLFLFVFEAHAIRRKCAGFYTAQILDNRSGPSLVSVGHFKGVGGCGRFVPNRCRRRARNRIINCMKEHWKYRELNERPTECTFSRNLLGYSMVSLEKDLQREICRKIYPRGGSRRTHRVRLSAESLGNTGCDKEHVLEERYRITCN